MGSGNSAAASSKIHHKARSKNTTAVRAEDIGDGNNENDAQQKMDLRLPYQQFREIFTLKNYWKTIRRNERDCAKTMFAKYLKQNPEVKDDYAKLKNIDVDMVSATLTDPGFEAVATNYLKVFDDVLTTLEEKPTDVADACSRLISVGKMHKHKVMGMDGGQFQLLEEPFLYMVSEVLQDRYNDKAENLFRKFFQFCLTYLLEGFNS
ncbi:unnamed protein product [Thelazia callipaeda]|uniref:GLOBIN domain-containing protein n=1 Tax=Thelazia callipaeda TaxID=103827 RepID=A0A158RAW9_THECL|nr:unnamed protein product [Thelazia callipaeda]